MKRVFGYIRVSSREQIDGHSLAAQERAIRDHCALHHFDLRHVFVDEGVSAHVDAIRKRPQFKEMLDAVSRREADVVIVHETSRWARNVGVAIQALKTLSDHDTAFISVTDNVDYSTPDGKLFMTILAGFNQFYSDKLGQHMEKATSGRRALNLHVGQVPFGWRSNGKSAALIEEREFDAVRRLMVEPFLTGAVAYADISQALNGAGWRTRSLKLIARHGEGGKWNADTVRTYLQRPFIAGYVAKGVKGEHPPLVSDEEWNRIQAIVEQRRLTHVYPKSANSSRRVYALAGLLRCIHCGTTLEADTVTNRHGQAYKRYSFVCGKRGHNCPGTGNRRHTTLAHGCSRPRHKTLLTRLLPSIASTSNDCCTRPTKRRSARSNARPSNNDWSATCACSRWATGTRAPIRSGVTTLRRLLAVSAPRKRLHWSAPRQRLKRSLTSLGY